MAAQHELAEHLDMSQPQISVIMERLGIDWKTATMDEVRIAYLRHLRGIASVVDGPNGESLTGERILTERVDRELKQLLVAEKRAFLVNIDQLEPELVNMVAAFRAVLLAADDKLKTDLDALYGIDLDLNLLHEYTRAALQQLLKYDVTH